MADKIEAQEIRISHPDNPDSSIVLTATGDVVGIWLTHKKRTISIYVMKSGDLGLGIYADTEHSNGMNIALSVDNDGNPYVQLVNAKGEVKELGFDDFNETKKSE